MVRPLRIEYRGAAMKNGRFERSASLPEDGVDLISVCIPKKNRASFETDMKGIPAWLRR